MTKRKPMPIEERAKRFLAAFAKHGGKAPAKAFRKLGEMEQCAIAGQVLGESIVPDSMGRYFVRCPGIGMHTGKNSRKDCRFTPGDGGHDSRTAAPTLHCLHQSCGSVIEEFNRRIRSEIGKAGVETISDHGCMINNAAAALLIGFDMNAEKAAAILAEFNQTLTPPHTQKQLAAAIELGCKAKSKKPEEVGYLLRKGQSSPKPPPVAKASFVSAADLTDDQNAELVHFEPGQKLYVGIKGRLARELEPMIEAYREDYGADPIAVLLGPDQPEIAGKLCGLPIERMNIPGLSVLGA